jgi:hypothetical protein
MGCGHNSLRDRGVVDSCKGSFDSAQDDNYISYASYFS